MEKSLLKVISVSNRRESGAGWKISREKSGKPGLEWGQVSPQCISPKGQP